MSGRTAPLISFTFIDNSISSLKNCQTYISTGMEIASGVALDLLENGNMTDVNSMESVMMEYAAMERDLKQYIKAVEQTVNTLKREQLEEIPDLKALVKERFSSLQGQNTDLDLQHNERVVQFKEQLREMSRQMGLSVESTAETFEDIDEDIAVTQSQTIFICPITQLEMENPVKNKVCGHTYEKEAIERLIQNRHQKKDKATCPKIGCGHNDMKIADLVPDTALKRAIEMQNRKRSRN
ncbi:E3 SUMO-protein ligase NSE2 [Bombina bombina]|uniref:E3 SUMO-protein ligase NSE2 n=1 Tax=Bombina bombina TaxID=8345 RepID=UPI00235AA562|nr:E3 SUMO-protein ligase NSE2 [Bombina bombina]